MIDKIVIHWSCDEPDMIRVLIYIDGESEAIWVQRTGDGWVLQDYFGFDGALEPFMRGADGARFAKACGEMVTAFALTDSTSRLLLTPKLDSAVCRDLVRYVQERGA